MRGMRQAIHLGLAAAAVAAVSGCASKAHEADATGGGQRIVIAVTERGFEPERVTVRAGEPVTLVVTRKTDRTCATEFVIKDEGINKPLPLNEPVSITFTPRQRGDLTYVCGMEMVKGQIVVR